MPPGDDNGGGELRRFCVLFACVILLQGTAASGSEVASAAASFEHQVSFGYVGRVLQGVHDIQVNLTQSQAEFTKEFGAHEEVFVEVLGANQTRRMGEMLIHQQQELRRAGDMIRDGFKAFDEGRGEDLMDPTSSADVAYQFVADTAFESGNALMDIVSTYQVINPLIEETVSDCACALLLRVLLDSGNSILQLSTEYVTLLDASAEWALDFTFEFRASTIPTPEAETPSGYSSGGCRYTWNGNGYDIEDKTDGPNTCNGSPHNDEIWMYGGADSASGGEGYDIIHMGSGDDTANGDSGHDVVYGGGGADVLRGYNGNDQLFGGEGPDEVYGGAGEDYLRLKQGHDDAFAGPGNDQIHGELGNDLVNGGDNADVFDDGEPYYHEFDSFNAGPGRDWADIQDVDIRDAFVGEGGNDSCPRYDDDGRNRDHVDLGDGEDSGDNFKCGLEPF